MQHIPQYEGTSGDHASVFDSLSELAVKSITFIFIFLNGLKEGLKNSQKKPWKWKSFNINFKCTKAYFSLLLTLPYIDNTDNVIIHIRQTVIIKLNQTDFNLNIHSLHTIMELHMYI